MKKFSPEFQKVKDFKFGLPPGDAPWNPHGFKHDYTHPDVSEMSAHMPLLVLLGSQCKTVTEFGSRRANSTVAFLSSGCEKVISYDIQPTAETIALMEMRSRGLLPCEWEFVCQNTIDPKYQIKETDLLMIDTLHTAHQVFHELEFHADQVKKYLVFHDVFSQSLLSLDVYGELGVAFPINRFIQDKSNEWEPIYKVMFNHGLLVLERKQDEKNSNGDRVSYQRETD